MKERIRINRFASNIVFQPLDPDTDSQLHEERVFQCERSRTRTLSSTSEMSQVECGHPGKLLVDVMSKIFQEVVKVQR